MLSVATARTLPSGDKAAGSDEAGHPHRSARGREVRRPPTRVRSVDAGRDVGGRAAAGSPSSVTSSTRPARACRRTSPVPRSTTCSGAPRPAVARSARPTCRGAGRRQRPQPADLAGPRARGCALDRPRGATSTTSRSSPPPSDEPPVRAATPGPARASPRRGPGARAATLLARRGVEAAQDPLSPGPATTSAEPSGRPGDAARLPRVVDRPTGGVPSSASRAQPVDVLAEVDRPPSARGPRPGSGPRCGPW